MRGRGKEGGESEQQGVGGVRILREGEMKSGKEEIWRWAYEKEIRGGCVKRIKKKKEQ